MASRLHADLDAHNAAPAAGQVFRFACRVGLAELERGGALDAPVTRRDVAL